MEKLKRAHRLASELGLPLDVPLGAATQLLSVSHSQIQKPLPRTGSQPEATVWIAAAADAARRLDELRSLAASWGFPLAALDRLALRVEEAAATVGVSPSLLRKEIRAGRLPVVRVGTVPVIRTSDLVAYLDANRATPTREADRIAEELAAAVDRLEG